MCDASMSKSSGANTRATSLRIQRRLDRERFKFPTVRSRKNQDEEKEEEGFLADFYSLYERRTRDNIGELDQHRARRD